MDSTKFNYLTIDTCSIDTVSPAITIDLIQVSDLRIAIKAIRKCADSEDKSDSSPDIIGPNDEKLIRHCLNDGHHSVFEHIVYTFDISNISRALLQEISRHRLASPSVQSTRWALKKLLNKIRTKDITDDSIYKDFLRQTGVDTIDAANVEQLRKAVLLEGISNDKLKYILPEAFLTSEQITINVRSLWNLLNLRLSKRALWEFRALAYGMYVLASRQHPILFEHIKDKAEAYIQQV